MKKAKFLSQLKKAMKGCPRDTVARTLDYYDEMISDRMEDGLDEDEAVALMEPVDVIARKIPSDSEAYQSGYQAGRRKLSGGVIALLILGSPLWISLLAALVGILAGLGAALAGITVALAAAEFALFAAGGVGFLGSMMELFTGHPLNALIVLGASLICLGLALVTIRPLMRLLPGAWRLLKKLFRKLKTTSIRKAA